MYFEDFKSQMDLRTEALIVPKSRVKSIIIFKSRVRSLNIP